MQTLFPAGLALGMALLGLVAAPVGASTPAAWKALGGRVDVPVADGTPSGKTPLISALLLEGTYPQAHMGGQKGRELCLFEQRTRRASSAEAEALEGPRPHPLNRHP